MSTVNTIRGPIDSSQLGRTLSHEHLTASAPGWERVPGWYSEADGVAKNVEAMKLAKAAGIDTLIDLTPLDLGRQVGLFQRMAEQDTGMHVVPATGAYRWPGFPYLVRDADAIAEYFLSEIRNGIEGTSIRAGIIKVAWDIEYHLEEGAMGPRAMMEKIARAAARASKAGGVPISCHTNAEMKLGDPLIEIFKDEGMDLRAVTIGHVNDSRDADWVVSLAKRGVTVGLDRFFLPGPNSPATAGTPEQYLEHRGGIALAMVRAGFASQTSLGHDASPYYRLGRDLSMSQCWLGVPNHELPWLRQHGATEQDIDAMMRVSIREQFEHAAAQRR